MIKTCLALSPTKANFAPLLFSGDLDEGLRNSSQLGYDGVELSLRDSNELDQDLIKNKLQASNLRAISFGTGQSYFQDQLSLANPDPVNQQKVRDRLRDHICFASKLGAMVVIGSVRGKLDESSQETRSAGYDITLEAVSELVDFALELDVILLLEPINRYETNFINTIGEALEFIDKIDSPNLLLLPDTFHMNIEEPDFSTGLIRAGKKLGHMHIVDSNRCAPGMGHIDFNQIVKDLKNIGYKGHLSGEILPFPDDYSAAAKWMDTIFPLIAE